MWWLCLLSGLMAFLAACAPTAPPPSELAMPGGPLARPELLVETTWLKDHLEDNDLRILDTRAPDQYQAGHIPTARNLPVEATHDTNHPVRGMVAPAEQIARLFGNLGVGQEHRMVVYDDGRSPGAARLFWVLDYYGHPKISLLNGGYLKWQRERLPVSTEVLHLEPAPFRAIPNPEKVATKEYILAQLGNKAVALCDARSAAEYTGQEARSRRGGHIPGAVNVEWVRNLTGSDTLVLQEIARLRSLYAQAGITPDKEVITYCQTAMRASMAYFGLRLLGYEKVRNYDGSWEEWGNDPQTPIVRD